MRSIEIVVPGNKSGTCSKIFILLAGILQINNLKRYSLSLMHYVFLVRVHQWVKNSFIFIPAFFAGTILQRENLILLIQGFFCFCFISSAIYIVNDYRDIVVDRLHPTKKNRPLASGKVKPPVALVIMAIMVVISLVWSYMLAPAFAYFIAFYMGINLAYSFGMKNISLVDIFMISSGFLVRTLAGANLVNVVVSHWLVIMVFLLSLFMAFAKRRDDLILAERSGKEVLRKSSRLYTVEYINVCLSVISGVIMVSYIMYTISDDVVRRIGENSLYVTSLFVFAGLLRYLQITLVQNDSGSPTKVLLTDRFIQIVIAGWILTFFFTIYV